MSIDERDMSTLAQLEESLWRGETRFDRDYMEGVVHLLPKRRHARARELASRTGIAGAHGEGPVQPDIHHDKRVQYEHDSDDVEACPPGAASAF